MMAPRCQIINVALPSVGRHVESPVPQFNILLEAVSHSLLNGKSWGWVFFVIFLMSSGSNFNIITGEIKQNYPLNSTSRRFSSQAQMTRAKQNGDYLQQLPPSIRRLGTSADSRAFNYGYATHKTLQGPSKVLQAPYSTMAYPEKTSLMNASKLAFNFINHTQNGQPAKWENTKKLAPFSKETHMGRFNAPNYSKEFAEKLSKNGSDFHRKRAACTQLCHIEKSYGVDKLFRKYK